MPSSRTTRRIRVAVGVLPQKLFSTQSVELGYRA
jgi:hypothetical protein